MNRRQQATMTKWNPDNPLGRAIGERAAQYDAFCDYVAMGSGRSLRKLHAAYMNENLDADPAIDQTIVAWSLRGPAPPTRRWPTLSAWSVRNQWQARLERAAEIEAEARNSRRVEARRRIEDEDLAASDRLIHLLDETLAAIEARIAQIEQAAEKAPDNKAEVRVLVSTGAAGEWIDVRRKAASLRRLALGMPDRITQDRHADAEGGRLAAKGYVGVNPDDWDLDDPEDEGDSDDDSPTG